MFWGELTHTVVSCGCTLIVCFLGDSTYIGIYKLVSSSVLGGELIPTVVSYVYKVVIYVVGVRLLVNMEP